MTTDAIKALEKRRHRAMLDGDVTTMAELLHDSLTWTHSSGVVDTRAGYLEKLGNGSLDYKDVEPIDEDVALLGDDTALVRGRLRLHVIVEGTEKDFIAQALSLWTNAGDQWRLVAFQSTKAE